MRVNALPAMFFSFQHLVTICFAAFALPRGRLPSTPSTQVTIHSAPEPALHVAGPMDPPQMRSFLPR